MLNTNNMYGGVAMAAQGGLIHTGGLIATGGLTLVPQQAFLTRAIWLGEAADP